MTQRNLPHILDLAERISWGFTRPEASPSEGTAVGQLELGLGPGTPDRVRTLIQVKKRRAAVNPTAGGLAVLVGRIGTMRGRSIRPPGDKAKVSGILVVGLIQPSADVEFTASSGRG